MVLTIHPDLVMVLSTTAAIQVPALTHLQVVPLMASKPVQVRATLSLVAPLRSQARLTIIASLLSSQACRTCHLPASRSDSASIALGLTTIPFKHSFAIPAMRLFL